MSRRPPRRSRSPTRPRRRSQRGPDRRGRLGRLTLWGADMWIKDRYRAYLDGTAVSRFILAACDLNVMARKSDTRPYIANIRGGRFAWCPGVRAMCGRRLPRSSAAVCRAAAAPIGPA